MQICTWNINGIRAFKEPLSSVIDKLGCDILCFQETKITRDQLDEASAIVDGYSSYFSFSKARSGYSGVATFAKNTSTPVFAEEGIASVDLTDIGCHGDYSNFTPEEIASLDNEGRCVMTLHTLRKPNGSDISVCIFNVYCPRAGVDNETRQLFKLRFCELLQNRAEAVLQSGCHVIIVGDMNISHKDIDHCKQQMERDILNGQMWLDEFLADPGSLDSSVTEFDYVGRGKHFVDTFRLFHPDQVEAYTNWCTVTGARATNYGQRIDYILADKWLALNAFEDCIIMPEVEGSDHCPVKASLKWMFVPSDKYSPMCTKFYPEFTGRQQKLTMFFNKNKAEMSNLKAQITEHSTQITIMDSVKANSKNEKTSLSSGKNSADKRTSTGKSGGEPPVKKGQTSLASFVKRVSVHTNTKTIQCFNENKNFNNSSCDSDHNKPIEYVSTQVTETNQSVTCHGSQFRDKSAIDKNSALLNNQAVQAVTIDDIDDSSCSNTEQLNMIDDSRSKLFKNDSHNKFPKNENTTTAWKSLLSGPGKPPLCKGHQESCVLRTVKKDSANRGKQFWVCAKPEGHKSNPQARCDHFEWVRGSK